MPVTFQSALHPAGVEAANISHLWWLMFWTCTVVYVVVWGVLLIALRGRGDQQSAPSHRRLVQAVAGASGVTIVVLFGLLVASTLTGRAMAALDTRNPVTITVTGNQWWWDIEYHHPDPSLRVRTANELHLPVGRPARIELASNDVIHSFWVPNLNGKTDLIPGRQTVTWLQADRPGVFRSQCAEFCGLQHAKMALAVVAESPADFQRWLDEQRRPAAAPSNEAQAMGHDVVTRGTCAMCHAVLGTTAGARTAPDLTHIASRKTIAAGADENTPTALKGWIADPQHLKPGNRMPATGLSAQQLNAVVAYLESLK
jgi:cytochrome c oxidase subunit II